MKIRVLLPFLCGSLFCNWTINARATQTWLAFRGGTTLHINGGFTGQTLATTFGTNLLSLPFAGTTSYDFYSLPVSADVPLFTNDKGGGVIYMRNNSSVVANDFSVSGRMEYFNYDPTTGTETLIVDTTASPPKDVNHGQTVNWAIPNALLAANTVIPVGHMIHIRMTLTLIAGNPANFGQVVYNGPNGPSTSGLLPQNRSKVLDWPFDLNSAGLIGSQPQIITCDPESDGRMTLTAVGVGGASYSIQATTDLAAPVWTTIGTRIAGGNGLFSFIDQDATNYPCRFYRLATP